ncbi:MAG TPA: VWA domain-containing protein [Candidatus Acidoferrales bacterium]|nr:VWA domain-containing protein [Candidatus Acidoferrales bacterium]
MSSSRARKAIGAMVMAAALAAAAGARTQDSPQDQAQDQQAPPEQIQKPLKVQVGVVNLFVTVRDKHHAIVSDLKKEDFHVYEDGKEQKIEFFSKEMNLPLTMAMLLDTSGSMDRMLPAEESTGAAFLERVMKKGDLTTLISFDQDADLLVDFTGSVAELERGLNRARINEPFAPVTPGTVPTRDPRGTVFYDAIYLAARDRLAQEVGRRAIVVLTDAVDEGSRVRLEEAIEAAQRADAVVHILLIFDPGYFFMQGSGAGVAHKISDETGGRVIEVRGAKHLEEAFTQLAEELRSQYSLGYYPSNGARDGRYRKVKVEVTRSDVHVLARKGYYAPKD